MEVIELIKRLALYSLGELQKARDSGAVPIKGDLYVKKTVTSFSHEPGKSSTLISSLSHITKPAWQAKEYNHFLTAQVETSEEFRACLECLARTYKVPESEVSPLLVQYVQVVTHMALVELTDEALYEWANILINDLKGEPTRRDVRVWLGGIWPEETEIHFRGGMKLRRPVAADLESETLASAQMTFPSVIDDTPDSILEFPIRTNDINVIQEEVGKIMDVLLLYRLGSVRHLNITSDAKSLRGMWRLSGNMNYERFLSYGVGPEDIDPINEALAKIKPLLPLNPSFGPPDSRDNILIISFPRYKEALLHRGTSESRITSAITCLESLYFRPTEKAELTYKLAQRVAFSLRYYGYDPLEVRKFVTKGYDIRSSYVHGSFLKKSERDKIANELPGLTEKVMEYARVSLLLFIQLKITENSRKDEHIGDMERATLSPHEEVKFRSKITEGIFISH